jgi:hypothetical protein
MLTPVMISATSTTPSLLQSPLHGRERVAVGVAGRVGVGEATRVDV